MKNSIKIGSVAQISIFVHWTFALLVIGLFAFYLIQGNTLASAVVGVGLVLAVFACVVLHELGHALTALHFGVPTRDITIYPIGGVARLQRIPEEPFKEFWIALAGPAVNVVIAGLIFVWLLVTGGTLSLMALMDPGDNLLTALMWLNAVLVGFNLLPAFPMDGGRVLRALLATRMEYTRATEIAANIGQGMAVLFGLLGLLGWNPILIFIALFVYVGAKQEARQALMRSLTRGIPVREAMVTRFHVLSPDDQLNVAIDELLAGAEQDFPVVEGGRVKGMLTRQEMMRALSERGREVRVGDIIDTQRCFTIEDTAMLDEAFVQMQATDCSAVPVMRRGEIVGLLTLENVGELMMISSALRQRGVEGAGAAKLPSGREESTG